MIARLVFDDSDAHAAIASDIEVTPAIEGGVGAVKLGKPAAAGDGRMIVAHHFAEVDTDWIEAYADDPRMIVERAED